MEIFDVHTLRLILPVAGALVASALILIHARRSKNQNVREMRNGWGQVPPYQPGVETARLLFDLNPGTEDTGVYVLDERSWQDLDGDQMFRCLDRCVSPVGSQVLYRTLRRPRRTAPVAERRRALVEHFSSD